MPSTTNTGPARRWRRDPTRNTRSPRAGAEIVAPVAAYVTPRWSANIAEADESAGEGRHRFEKLRWFKNWPTAGIAYAAPDMGAANFWGVINHDNGEGIIRIADNKCDAGPENVDLGISVAGERRRRPHQAEPGAAYVELWAGVSDQFFHSATLARAG